MKNPANGFVGVRVVDNGDVIKMWSEDHISKIEQLLEEKVNEKLERTL
jgi:hypothetical protein